MCVGEGGCSVTNALHLKCLRHPGEDGNYAAVYVSPEHTVWAGDRHPGVIDIEVEFKIMERHAHRLRRNIRENARPREKLGQLA